MNKVNYPFRVVVNKEISDHVKSWRFIILMGIILLTCMGSLYTSLTNIGAAIKPNDPDGSFLFLKLFTASDGTLPSFVQFINFLGPLLGIALGFDAINSEQNKGTLSRMLSQPVHRDCIINAKFVAALIVIGIMLFVLGFLVMGCGLIAIGIPPTAEEFWRIVFFLIISVFYVAFWLNLAILFSLCFQSGGHLGIGFGGGMVVFQRVLYDDCQSGCQGIEPFAAGISLSDSQLPEIYSRSDASGT